MNATSTLVLNTGLNSMVGLFLSFLQYAMSNWIGVVVSIVVVVGVIGLIIGKVYQVFHGGRR